MGKTFRKLDKNAKKKMIEQYKKLKDSKKYKRTTILVSNTEDKELNSDE